MRKILFLVFLNSLFLISFSQLALDNDAIQKIKKEGLENSQVMNIAFHLTDVSGPRLTNSPGYDKASKWAIAELTKWGLTNARLDPWGEFGKGWELKKSYIAMTAPYYRPLIGYPKAWTSGTSGLKSGEILLIEATDTIQLEQYKGKLSNKILLVYRKDTLKHSFKPDANRYTEEELEKMSKAEPQQPRARMDSTQRQAMQQRMRSTTAFNNKLKEWAKQEGAISILSMNPRGHDGTLFVQGGGAYTATSPENFLDMVIAAEDYLSLCRLVKSGEKVKMDLDVQTSFNQKDTKAYNVIAEIPGSDPNLKAEVVMIGGHLDSWQGSTGATDNAAGCAVMMEAVRILKASGLKPKRTIRIALWSGEEQGLFGSRNYVKNHLGDPATMKLMPEQQNISAYYNLDNGTGKIRGIYLQGNEAVRPLFTNWLQPFIGDGASTVTINNTGGTDHLAFDAVGVPGFQFIQDPIEYDTRTHHTNMDTYDHLVPEDLKQASVIVASFVYNTAMRDEKIPRKELPKPREGQRPI
jgi:carboxypeptidase Q